MSLEGGRCHPLLPYLPPPSLLCFFVLVDAGSTHLNANKIKPLSARNATHSRVVTSHR
jgi:hypothetical protein